MDDRQATVLPPDYDALEFLKAIYTNPDLPLHVRMDAARAAIKYERPTLSAVAIRHQFAGLAERLEVARTRASTFEVIRP